MQIYLKIASLSFPRHIYRLSHDLTMAFLGIPRMFLYLHARTYTRKGWQIPMYIYKRYIVRVVIWSGLRFTFLPLPKDFDGETLGSKFEIYSGFTLIQTDTVFGCFFLFYKALYNKHLVLLWFCVGIQWNSVNLHSIWCYPYDTLF